MQYLAALKPGDNIMLTTVGGQQLKPVWGSFLVTDYLKTEMSEYDQSFVYVPLDQLQRIRGQLPPRQRGENSAADWQWHAGQARLAAFGRDGQGAQPA